MAPTKIAKVERLMNLVIALLSTRGHLTAEWIRGNVIGYGDCPTDDAFARMFERDKSELRELGIPLETGRVAGSDGAEGYRIKPDAYALPDIDLTPDEAAAVAVATKLWESPERVTATQSALLKLRAAGVEVDPAAGAAVATGVGPTGPRGSEEALGVLLCAIDTGRPVRFRHRPSPVEPYALRHVEPWGVVTARGRWYLVGHDRDRAATRTFRLSRIVDVEPDGEPGRVSRPAGADLRGIVDRAIGEAGGGGAGVATVWVADGQATALRRIGRPVGRRTVGGRAGDVVELDAGGSDWLARELAGHGAATLVLEPQSLRREVLARLAAQAGTRA